MSIRRLCGPAGTGAIIANTSRASDPAATVSSDLSISNGARTVRLAVTRKTPKLSSRRITTGQGTDERGLAYLKAGGDARASTVGDWSETYACNLFRLAFEDARKTRLAYRVGAMGLQGLCLPATR